MSDWSVNTIRDGEQYTVYKNGKPHYVGTRDEINDMIVTDNLKGEFDGGITDDDMKTIYDKFTALSENLKEYKKNTSKETSKAKTENSSSPSSAFSQTNTTDLGNFNVEKMVSDTKFYRDKGIDIENLVYPKDLLNINNNNPAYNGCYTVFFISEHTESSIVSKNSASTYRYNGRNGYIAEDTERYGSNDTLMRGLASVGATVAVYKGTSALLGPLVKESEMFGMATGAIIGAGAGATVYTGNVVGTNNTQYTQLKSCIALPTPFLEQQNNIEWSNEGSTLTGNIASAIAKSSSYISDADLSGLSGWKNLLDTSIQGSKDFGSMLALTSSNAGLDILQRMSSKTANTRKEQLFKDVEFRKYRFSYDLYARSQEEMRNIHSIIRAFKYHAHPELSNSDFLYIYPAQFDIVHYFNGKPNPYFPKHATSILTSIDVQYGSNDVPTINRDGSPTLIKLDLEFTELAVLNKKDIAKGY